MKRIWRTATRTNQGREEACRAENEEPVAKNHVHKQFETFVAVGPRALGRAGKRLQYET
jgi:hypothetical protein